MAFILVPCKDCVVNAATRIVGYGLDDTERYRNLPCIGVHREQLIVAG